MNETVKTKRFTLTHTYNFDSVNVLLVAFCSKPLGRVKKLKQEVPLDQHCLHFLKVVYTNYRPLIIINNNYNNNIIIIIINISLIYINVSLKFK